MVGISMFSHRRSLFELTQVHTYLCIRWRRVYTEYKYLNIEENKNNCIRLMSMEIYRELSVGVSKMSNIKRRGKNEVKKIFIK